MKNFGGHLAVIEDEGENNYLKQLARSETPKVPTIYEPRIEKTNVLHMRKQR